MMRYHGNLLYSAPVLANSRNPSTVSKKVHVSCNQFLSENALVMENSPSRPCYPGGRIHTFIVSGTIYIYIWKLLNERISEKNHDTTNPTTINADGSPRPCTVTEEME